MHGTNYLKILIAVLLAVCLVEMWALCVDAEKAAKETEREMTSRLRISPDGRYFLDGDKPVVLFGSGLWTIISDGTIDIEDHNSWYAQYGANANRAALFAFCTAVGG